MEFKAAKCPTCGGQLQVPDDRNTFHCMYCGSTIVVREVLRAEPGASIGNLLTLAKNAIDGGNVDEANRYYTQVLEYDSANWEAWFGKAQAAGWSSTLADLRIPEMLSCFQQAIENAPPQDQDDVAHRAADAISSVCATLYSMSHDHMCKFFSLDDAWPEYLDRYHQILHTLEQTHRRSPGNPEVLTQIIYTQEVHLHATITLASSWTAPEVVGDLRRSLAEYVAKMTALDPHYDPPQLDRIEAPKGKGTSPCFVATAAAGSPSHYSVLLLQDFRERQLRCSAFGRLSIKAYELVGPPLARLVATHPLLRTTAYYLVVAPAAHLTAKWQLWSGGSRANGQLGGQLRKRARS